jgi:NNP family nitrate/nitrite transporter-like MFS transporter
MLRLMNNTAPICPPPAACGPGFDRMAAPGVQLAAATAAFAVCFAVFGSFGAMMPEVSLRLQLTDMQKSFAVALPALLGSLARIPIGICTDRAGGRLVFTLAMLCALVPVTLMPFVETYRQLVACGFLFGVPMSVFPIGIAMVSGWHPREKQGRALGLYGVGGAGQALAAFGAPLLATHLGSAWGFWFFSLLLGVMIAVFLVVARNPARKGPAKRRADFARPLFRRMSWVLSGYYFLTFGGLVTMSVYLPIFFVDMFGLSKTDAGFRAALFLVLATLIRPLGGVLSDRFGGARLLLIVFPVVAALALVMAWSPPAVFTAAALGIAAAIGIGNGAVFKLLPAYFPNSVGTVTGLVGAVGGLGGFFPPLFIGKTRAWTQSHTWGFAGLALFSMGCLAVCVWVWKTEPPPDQDTQAL